MTGQVPSFDTPMPINGNQQDRGRYEYPKLILLHEISEKGKKILVYLSFHGLLLDLRSPVGSDFLEALHGRILPLSENECGTEVRG